MRIERAELAERLTVLGVSVSDRLTSEQQGWYAEFVDVGEYGLALEMISDWLSEDELPISEPERTEAAELSTAMGNYERVMGPLRLCPPGT